MKNQPTKQRTISYHRANWPDLNDGNLQEVIASCLEQFPDVETTRVDLNDGLAEIRHRKFSNNMLFLHVAAWTDRQEASTVPHNVTGENSDLQSHPPAKDWDYLDGDGMMLIKDSDCL